MHLGLEDGVVALGLLGAVAAMLAVAPALRIPYPILLVLGGLAIGVIPGMPNVELQPELVFFGVLPPLLYGAAFFTSLRDLRANVRPIGLLAVGLVVMTTVGVAVVAHAFIDGLTWPSAFVLGAIVSPTDPIAATAIARRLGVPRKLVALVEGESLVNDGTGLVLYRVAVAAVVTGSFSALGTGGLFVVSALGGVAVGLAVAWIVTPGTAPSRQPAGGDHTLAAHRLLRVHPGRVAGRVGRARSRDRRDLPRLVHAGAHDPAGAPARSRGVGDRPVPPERPPLRARRPAATCRDRRTRRHSRCEASRVRRARKPRGIALRFIWVFAVLHAPKLLARRMSSWRGAVFVSWAGMRGALSLAAALALPLQTDADVAFPGRDLILFLTFSVILATLVGQGLTLPLVIRVLGLEDDGIDAREEAKARIRAAEAAVARLDELEQEEWVREDTAERLRGLYRFRTDRFMARFEDGDDGAIESRSQDYQRLRRELLDAEREAVNDLRRTGAISNDVWIRVSRDLDLEDQRLDI